VAIRYREEFALQQHGLPAPERGRGAAKSMSTHHESHGSMMTGATPRGKSLEAPAWREGGARL